MSEEVQGLRQKEGKQLLRMWEIEAQSYWELLRSCRVCASEGV